MVEDVEIFGIANLCAAVDRHPQTIYRWERENLIPPPRRDSRKRRIYTQDEIDKIVSLVEKTEYFSVKGGD
jgi:DNA-binding transcriptional MerR regulator